MWRLPSGIKRFPFLGENKVGAMSKEPKHQVEGIIKSLLTKLHHSLPVKYPSGRFQTSVKNISGRFQPNFKLLQLLVFSQGRDLKEMACLSFACSCWQFCKTEECDRFGFSPSFFFSSSSLLLAQPLPGRVASKRFATILSGIMFRQKNMFRMTTNNWKRRMRGRMRSEAPEVWILSDKKSRRRCWPDHHWL